MENESRNLTIGTLIRVAHALDSRVEIASWGPSPLPPFFVSVASKGLEFRVSDLESTLVNAYVSVDSKGT
jgi:hypothetical protein